MSRRLVVVFSLSLLTVSAASFAHAEDTALTLSLFRAVRISDSSITLSFKTSEAATGSVAYTEVDGSKLTLTDSVPQVDHLFTVTQLDPKHGYSFVLTASVGSTTAHLYTVLLAPESIGPSGARIIPGVQETTASGNIVSTSLSTSSVPGPTKPIAPWWAFALLGIVAVVGSIGYEGYRSQRIS